ncbi:MAG TPA: hypothetical protein VM537_31870, partial [Anaerolineae bacterium]|nr:hypothetical protein [Anaerolineae bacterium]
CRMRIFGQHSTAQGDDVALRGKGVSASTAPDGTGVFPVLIIYSPVQRAHQSAYVVKQGEASLWRLAGVPGAEEPVQGGRRHCASPWSAWPP